MSIEQSLFSIHVRNFGIVKRIYYDYPLSVFPSRPISLPTDPPIILLSQTIPQAHLLSLAQHILLSPHPASDRFLSTRTFTNDKERKQPPTSLELATMQHHLALVLVTLQLAYLATVSTIPAVVAATYTP